MCATGTSRNLGGPDASEVNPDGHRVTKPRGRANPDTGAKVPLASSKQTGGPAGLPLAAGELTMPTLTSPTTETA